MSTLYFLLQRGTLIKPSDDHDEQLGVDLVPGGHTTEDNKEDSSIKHSKFKVRGPHRLFVMMLSPSTF